MLNVKKISGEKLSQLLLLCGSSCLIFAILFFPVHTTRANLYTSSAHGNATSGVCLEGVCEDSAGSNHGYSRGNCANCHEMHASMGGSEPVPIDSVSEFTLLNTVFNSGATSGAYTSDDAVCFYCHGAGSDHQVFAAGQDMLNYDYSEVYGLYSGSGLDAGQDTLLELFNQYDDTLKTGSNHNLAAVQSYAATNFSSYFHSNSDPCSACHNVHLAKPYMHHADEPGYSAISRPTDHNNLWGDSAGENMDDYAGIYLAPYAWPAGSANYEPGGTTITTGSTIPDYNSYCLDCHGPDAPATITSVNRGGVLKTIYWLDRVDTGDAQDSGDKHGENTTPYATDVVQTRAPYNGTQDLVLSCLDCHEAHGSIHKTLLRRAINGTPVYNSLDSTSEIIGDDDGDRGWQCRQCHKDDYELLQATETNKNKWKTTHHGGGADNPYKSISGLSGSVVYTNGAFDPGGSCRCHISGSTKINCEGCHGHGSWLSGVANQTIDVGTDYERQIPPPNTENDGDTGNTSNVYSRKSF